MRKVIKTMLIALSMTFATIAVAHAQTKMYPTDIDLMAAYCIPQRVELANLQNEMPDQAESRKETLSQITRLKAYLMPKMMQFDSIGLQAIKTAINRSKQDSQFLERTIENGLKNRSAAEGAVNRLQRCVKLEFLPY
jgi:alpha-L-fucosidase